MRKLILAIGLVLVPLVWPSGVGAETIMPERDSRIFYSNGGRILSINPDGSGRKALTRKGKISNVEILSRDENKAYDRFPRVSPYGDKVLFFRQSDFDYTDSDFYASGKTMVVGANGGKPRTLFGKAKRKDLLRDASWIPGSPNLLAVRHQRSVGRNSVVVVTPRGKVVRTVVKLRKEGKFSFKRGLPSYFVANQLSVSPDGTKFLMARDDVWASKSSRLEIVDMKTGKRRLVRKGGHQGRWSADGSRIVFVAEGTGAEICPGGECRKPYDVFTADSNGRNVKRVKATKYDEQWPSFSPDGTAIVVAANRNRPTVLESGEIYRIGPQGNCVDWLTNGAPASGEPDWGPGTSPAFNCDGPSKRRALVEGSPGPLDIPSWGPRFWLGKNHGGALPSSSITFLGMSLIDYGDCAEFRGKDCPRPMMVAQVPVCLVGPYIAPALHVLNKRKLNSRFKIKRGKVRGVRFRTAYASGLSFALTFTGESIVATMQKSGGVRSGRVDQVRLIRDLRPIGGDAAGSLPTFRVPAFALRHSRKVKRLVRRLGVKKTAKRLDKTRWEIRSQLRLRANLRQVGPVKPVRCSYKRTVKELFEVDSMTASSAARALEHPAVRSLSRNLPSVDVVPDSIMRLFDR